MAAGLAGECFIDDLDNNLTEGYWVALNTHVAKPRRKSMKVSFTLPTFKLDKDGKVTSESDERRAEVTIKASECTAITIVASGKEFHVDHEDFMKAVEFIKGEYC